MRSLRVKTKRLQIDTHSNRFTTSMTKSDANTLILSTRLQAARNEQEARCAETFRRQPEEPKKLRRRKVREPKMGACIVALSVLAQ